MGRTKKLSIAEKTRAIRLAKHINQDDIATAIGRGVHTVIKTENGKRNYKEDELTAIRKYLHIEDIPLTDDELARFKGQLYVFRERIKEELLDEARKMQSRLAIITIYPFEPDLQMLYKTIEARLLLKDGEYDKAGDNLKLIKSQLEHTTDEVRYHYYYAMGSLCLYKRNHEEALGFYREAERVESSSFAEENSLDFNLAVCYFRFGMYLLSIASLERIYNSDNRGLTSATGITHDVTLGLNYMVMGHYDKAKKLFNEALVRAEDLNNKYRTGGILHNLGCIYYKTKKYEKATMFFERASMYVEQKSNEYIENLFYKTLCLIASKSSESKLELSNAKLIAKGNEHYAFLLDSLSHIMTLKEKESRQYIEDVTIPYLLEKYKYFEVLIFYEELKRFFAKNKTKTYEIMSSIGEVQRRMMRENIDVKE
ncbi:MAG: tetratricopeptide repeat protein [Defluviitaleaceae bacterium]|nr:tetratricopeptide repeat protein [Defluviitaleaceae bacterium]